MKAGLEDCCLSKHRSPIGYGTLLARRAPGAVAQHPAKQLRFSEEHPGVKRRAAGRQVPLVQKDTDPKAENIKSFWKTTAIEKGNEEVSPSGAAL